MYLRLILFTSHKSERPLVPAWTDARSVFLSDIHLGWKYSKPASLIRILSKFRPEFLYLVGDTFEWYHSGCKADDNCLRIIDLFREMSSRGTSIALIPGNHDAQLADYATYFNLAVRPRITHFTASGDLYLVTHGDVFDLHRPETLSTIERFGSLMYPSMLAVGETLSKIGLKPMGLETHWCSRWKRKCKRAEQHIHAFEVFMANLAEHHQCDGVICGHIHRPAHRNIGGTWYINCGDWVEHCSFVIEDQTGELSLQFTESVELAQGSVAFQ